MDFDRNTSRMKLGKLHFEYFNETHMVSFNIEMNSDFIKY